MTVEEIDKIMEIAGNLDINKVKITGGEPLIRKDIIDIVRVCAKHMDEVSMTTNGVLLAPMAPQLKEAGLDRVNVSLDTFDPKLYSELTGYHMLEEVLSGIKAAIEADLTPVKLNIVVLPIYKPEELYGIVKKVWDLGAVPQLIEPIGDDVKSIDAIEEYFSQKAHFMKERSMHRRKNYFFEEGKVEFVRPMHNKKFCKYCTRLRVASNGGLKPCLMHNEGVVDILKPIKEGKDNEILTKIFEEAINNRRPYWK